MLIRGNLSVRATLALGRGLRAASSVSQAEVDKFNRLKRRVVFFSAVFAPRLQCI